MNKTINRCEAPYMTWWFIILLNAFNKVMASLRSDGSMRCCCWYVCTTLITSVMFVCFSRCVRFWHQLGIIALYFMRRSWFNKMKKKQALFPNQLLVGLRELEQQGADPGFSHILFYVRCLSLYMQMAQRSQISFEVIKSLYCSL